MAFIPEFRFLPPDYTYERPIQNKTSPSLFSRISSSFTLIADSFRGSQAASASHNKYLAHRLEKNERLKQLHVSCKQLDAETKNLNTIKKNYDRSELSMPLIRLENLDTVENLYSSITDQFKTLYEAHELDSVEIASREKFLRKRAVTLENRRVLSSKEVETALVSLHENYPGYKSGTTLNVCFIANNHIYTANIGDSRSVLVDCKNQKGIQLSEDAKPDNPRHQRVIENLGGTVCMERINGDLAVGSALGDHYCKGINPTVDITKTLLPKNGSILVIGCDGIWDVASSQKIVDAILPHLEKSMESLATDLLYSAFKAGSKDNLSTLVVKIPPRITAAAGMELAYN